jgi:hypothetical protein
MTATQEAPVKPDLYDFNRNLQQAVELREGAENARESADNALYQTLSLCLDIALHAHADIDSFKKAVAALKLPDIKSSKVEAQVINAVFGKDTKRANRYGTVMRLGVDAGQTPETLPEWLRRCGGIDNVRSGKSEAGTDEHQLYLEGLAFLKSANPIGEFRTNLKATPDHFVVMLATIRANGTARAVHIMKDDKRSLSTQMVRRVARERQKPQIITFPKGSATEREILVQARQQGVLVETSRRRSSAAVKEGA